MLVEPSVEAQLKPFILLVLLVCFASLKIIFSKANENIGNKREVLAFKGMLVSFMVYILVDLRLLVGDSFYTMLPRPIVLFIISSGFAAMSFSCFFWFMHVYSTILFSNRVQKIKAHWLYKILIHLPLLICLLFLYTPLYRNIYELTDVPTFKPLLILLLLMDYIYLIAATVVSVRKRRKAQTKLEKKKYGSQILFIVFFTISGILIGFLLNLPAIELCVIPVVLNIFVQLQDSQIYTDALTKLYNRRRVNEFINDELATCSQENPLSIVMIDLDYFKSINDILGHDEGDKALVVFSDALDSIFRSKNAIVGRWGGDEFIVVGKEKELAQGLREKLTDFLEKNNTLAYVPLFSVGVYECCQPGMSYEQAIAQADAALYKDKEVQHTTGKDFVETLKNITR